MDYNTIQVSDIPEKWGEFQTSCVAYLEMRLEPAPKRAIHILWRTSRGMITLRVARHAIYISIADAVSVVKSVSTSAMEVMVDSG